MTETAESVRAHGLCVSRFATGPNKIFSCRVKAPLMTHGNVMPPAFIRKASQRKH